MKARVEAIVFMAISVILSALLCVWLTANASPVLGNIAGIVMVLIAAAATWGISNLITSDARN